MKKKNKALAAIFLLAAVLLLTACGNVSYKDGTYTSQSAPYESFEDDGEDLGNGYGEVTITIKDGKITDCVFNTYELDGTLKDEDYGKVDGEIKNEAFYTVAQNAVKACENYAQQLVAKNDPDKVDAVTGATINCDEFKEAVSGALKQARG